MVGEHGADGDTTGAPAGLVPIDAVRAMLQDLDEMIVACAAGS